MNRIILYILVLAFAFGLTSPVFAATPYDQIGIASAVLNTSNGKLVDGKNQNVVLPLASLTKLMTALVLLDLKINFRDKVVYTQQEHDYVRPFIDEGDITSKVNMRPGDKVTKGDLWHAMLIASSNEAAIALVDNAGITRAQFVQRMNKKARSYGLVKTWFTEPSGIDPRNLGTAKEMAVIARKAYLHSSIKLASAATEYRFKDLLTGRKINIYSRNTSLLAMNPLGMKVGYLTEAKLNVALRLKKSVKDRVVVVLHAVNSSRRNKEITRLMAK